jgi:hypothetical protein
LSVERLRREARHGERHVLQVFTAALSRHDDRVECTAVGGRIGETDSARENGANSQAELGNG